MADKFDRFTKKARRVLSLAQEEAEALNHGYIGTEHLLLGLFQEDDGVAARVLKDLGVDLPKVRGAVEAVAGRGPRATIGRIGLAPRAKLVIELATDEARRMGHPSISTEHLLLALTRESGGGAAAALARLGVSLDHVREHTLAVMRGAPPETETPPPPGDPASRHAVTYGPSSRWDRRTAFLLGVVVGALATAVLVLLGRGLDFGL